MQRPDARTSASLVDEKIALSSLSGNKLQEDVERRVSLWWPSGRSPEGLPLLVCLASYLNSGQSLTGWRLFGESLPERLERLYETGEMGAAVVAFVDSSNRLGGTQFVNSPIVGNWVEALADDLVPAIETNYGCGGAGRRGLFGHSSGGYGALYNLAKRPDTWSAAASHAGDCGFPLVYSADMPKALRVLAAYDFDIKAFLDAFWAQEKPKGDQISALMMLAMAASYDPSDNPSDPLGLRLPVTHHTCTYIKERWANWLSFDLLSFGAPEMAALGKAKLVYFDCGLSDEYNILYGSRRFQQMLSDKGVSHDYREFEGGHGTIGPRYEVSLPLLVDVLKTDG